MTAILNINIASGAPTLGNAVYGTLAVSGEMPTGHQVHHGAAGAVLVLELPRSLSDQALNSLTDHLGAGSLYQHDKETGSGTFTRANGDTQRPADSFDIDGSPLY